jgi:hypothetical protein
MCLWCQGEAGQRLLSGPITCMTCAEDVIDLIMCLTAHDKSSSAHELRTASPLPFMMLLINHANKHSNAHTDVLLCHVVNLCHFCRTPQEVLVLLDAASRIPRGMSLQLGSAPGTRAPAAAPWYATPSLQSGAQLPCRHWTIIQ